MRASSMKLRMNRPSRALAGRMRGANYNVVALASDGECNEGSMWESALLAAAQRVERFCVVIDFNKWQATGRSEEVLALSPLREKWQAFGWEAVEIDGHDIDAIVRELDRPTADLGRPKAIIAHTVKGRGVSFMEDDNNWHYRIPDAAEVESAARQLEPALP